jgi:hypothetical protein
MKAKIQTIVTIIIGVVVALPCVMIFNDNESFLPNFIGMAYFAGLIAFSKYTKLGKRFAKRLEEINDKF